VPQQLPEGKHLAVLEAMALINPMISRRKALVMDYRCTTLPFSEVLGFGEHIQPGKSIRDEL
jgi:hypothetical protein